MHLSKFLQKNHCDYEIAVKSGTIYDNYLFSYINPENIYLYESSLDLNIIKYRVDGMFTIFLLNLIFPLNEDARKRQSFDFTSVADLMFKKCSSDRKRIAVIGGTENDVVTFCNMIQKKYPKLNICCYMDGYQSDTNMIKTINDNNPDVLLLGLGTIKQEKFGHSIIKNKIMNGPVFTCGAFISQTANSKRSTLEYYPHFIQKFNLRFVYRFFYEKKTRSRYKFYPRFLSTLLRLKLEAERL